MSSTALLPPNTDQVLSRRLHGKAAEKKTGLAAIASKDVDEQSRKLQEYFEFWDRNHENESEEDRARRIDGYKSVVNSYYDLATDLYEYGWSQSFHFSRFYKGEAFAQSIARHEHYLAYRMGIKPGSRVLDVGCGVGGPAREITEFTGCNLVGLNNNDYQISRCNNYAVKRNLDKKQVFVKGDFMHMPFEDNTFDYVYAIEATVHAPSLEGVYGEIFRVLKPGGVFGVYEWVMSDDYDSSIPKHREIAYNIEVGDGIPQMVRKCDAVEAIKKVGFNLLEEDDLTDHDNPDLPWYYPLTGDITKCQNIWDVFTVFRTSRLGKLVTRYSVQFLEKIGVAAKGTSKVGDTLAIAQKGLIEGGETHLFTPMFLMIAKKPETDA
ncbi:Sterol 24-C-methyltransferase erg6 [Schizosaccharomyces pombe]|uniref:Sterol 24-C-methyltransferase erg6 n=1 Tax=Schizosaccharomyces pombe (strain 972 / ATCC 24843) TaxID=284812 RepID=ERG6_SCHPO|nr:sterol 24-C-methyltransferase Erg6 [Schizosaccharomyces pombe]O14321.1 RecName: Full=Sterol 24-C-methyltransferase erg6; Short=SCMT; Short=SMT; AltName: Full=Delta(24)-sterol C-methyltransferase erg6; AltName: Full=Ergosterol biosynthesis protein 6 [Schizosaccharomyces pombe 972h-]CAB16897.1 sterol 24-C-methyltransferase Erg6 [Schizosaccharomyces pombe]|eukprot:NP_595787.1 sterol 24-C-methyltransferase Erg6 [Schizosaccharomyces pombe]